MVNGNKGVDTITVNGAATTSSVYGGGGNDIITDGAVALSDTLISGDLGNDTITLGNGGLAIDGITVAGGEGVDTITLGDAGLNTANDTGVLITGDAGNDTITGTSANGVEVTINGGAGNDDLNAGAGNGSETIIGGAGTDTMSTAAGVEYIWYDALGQGGSAASATSTSTVTAGDVVDVFTVNADFVNFAAATLVGSTATATAGATDAWNLNNTGVFVDTGDSTITVGTTTYAAVAAQIGTVVGTAGDTAYYVQNNAGGTLASIFQLTLGTTRSTTGALNAGDELTLIAQVTTGC